MAVKRKFIVRTQDLPSPSSSAQHIIRFRVVSEDRNRASDWSPIFVLNSSGQIPFSGSTVYVLTSASVNNSTLLDFIWSGPHVLFHDELDAYPHDVFVKWNNEDYVFYGTIVGNSLRVIARSNPPSSSASFIVQSPSYPVVPYLSAATGIVTPQITPILSSTLKILETDTIVY